MLSKLNRPGIRFFAASLAAVLLDYVLTLILFHVTPLSLTLISGLNFFGIGILIYFVHEFWSFQGEHSKFSSRRMAGNLAALCVAGAVRIGLIGALETMRAPAGLWVTIYFAIGVAGSFTTNFLLNRFFVFRR